MSPGPVRLSRSQASWTASPASLAEPSVWQATARSDDGGRYRFDGPIVLDCGGAFGYTVRVIPRNDLLTSVAELGVVAVA